MKDRRKAWVEFTLREWESHKNGKVAREGGDVRFKFMGKEKGVKDDKGN